MASQFVGEDELRDLRVRQRPAERDRLARTATLFNGLIEIARHVSPMRCSIY